MSFAIRMFRTHVPRDMGQGYPKSASIRQAGLTHGSCDRIEGRSNLPAPIDYRNASKYLRQNHCRTRRSRSPEQRRNPRLGLPYLVRIEVPG
jgi:hypothetical protein